MDTTCVERPWPPLSMNCCGCSDSDGTTFFKHLIFLLLYGCTTLKPGSVEIFGEHSLPLCGFETDLQPACVGHAWPICLERACLSNKLTERTELKELFSLAYKGSPLIWVANSSLYQEEQFLQLSSLGYAGPISVSSFRSLLLWPIWAEPCMLLS